MSDYDYGDDNASDYALLGPCAPPGARGAAALLYLHAAICAVGLVGNGLVIVTYACYKRTASMTDVYLLNVAVADILFVASLPLIGYNELWAWPMGRPACKLLRGAYSVNLFSGTLLLACVSADRYVAVVRPRRSFRLRSPPRGRLVSGAVWAAALLLSGPTFYFYDRYEPAHAADAFADEGGANRTAAPPRYVCEFRFPDNATARRGKVALPATQLAAGFFLPLVVMVICYGAIAAALLRARSLRRHRAVRVVLAVVAVFVACHLPYNLTLLVDTAGLFALRSCEEAELLEAAKTATQTLAYLHCCLNPVLYAFVGAKFRGHFRRIVLDLWRRGRRVAMESAASTRRAASASSDTGSSFTM